MIKITMNNTGGEIDSREVKTPVDVPEAISEMVLAAGEIFPGDSIVISGEAEND